MSLNIILMCDQPVFQIQQGPIILDQIWTRILPEYIWYGTQKYQTGNQNLTHSIELCMPPPTGPLVMLWPWPLALFLLKCINTESLAKFSPAVFKTRNYQRQKCIFQHVGPKHYLELWPFDSKTWNTSCPKMHKNWKFDQNMSNTLKLSC